MKKEIMDLHKEIDRLNAIISGAATILTLYDAGKYDTKEELVETIYKARDVLHDANKEGHNHQNIQEFFETWLQTRCSHCTKHHANGESVKLC